MFAIFLTEGMDPFYQNLSSFPTLVFSFLLLLVVLFWLVAILGVVEIDVLDFDIPDADGTIDVNHDTGLDTPSVLGGIMLRFGLAGVPVTIIISFVALFGWLICYYASYFLMGWMESTLLRLAVGAPILFASFYVSIMITSWIIRPLRPLFERAQQETVKRVLGQTATVRSSVADNEFGEAILDDGGAGLILKIRSRGSDRFKQGDRVVLLEELENENAYRVVSESEFKNG